MASTMSISQDETKTGFMLPLMDGGDLSAAAGPAPHVEGVEGSQEISMSLPGRLLALLVPIAGLAMYLVWKSQKPEKAKTAGCLAAWGFGLNLILHVLTSTA
jgi:hypothetical protein